jgi:hypothetical protein
LQSVRQVDLALRTDRFLSRDSRLLRARINFHQRGAARDTVARFHVDPREISLDLRLHVRLLARFDRADEVGGLFHRLGFERHDVDRHRRHIAATSSTTAASATRGRSSASTTGGCAEK